MNEQRKEEKTNRCFYLGFGGSGRTGRSALKAWPVTMEGSAPPPLWEISSLTGTPTADANARARPASAGLLMGAQMG